MSSLCGGRFAYTMGRNAGGGLGVSSPHGQGGAHRSARRRLPAAPLVDAGLGPQRRGQRPAPTVVASGGLPSARARVAGAPGGTGRYGTQRNRLRFEVSDECDMDLRSRAPRCAHDASVSREEGGALCASLRAIGEGYPVSMLGIRPVARSTASWAASSAGADPRSSRDWRKQYRRKDYWRTTQSTSDTSGAPRSCTPGGVAAAALDRMPFAFAVPMDWLSALLCVCVCVC